MASIKKGAIDLSSYYSSISMPFRARFHLPHFTELDSSFFSAWTNYARAVMHRACYVHIKKVGISRARYSDFSPQKLGEIYENSSIKMLD